MMTDINYTDNKMPLVTHIIALYESSGINRPINDLARIQQMYINSNLIIAAWDGDLLVGIARSITDFCYCCYLSDLAVRKEYQHRGIGKKLVALTKENAGENSMLLLLSAPAAMDYYPKIGMKNLDNAFMISRK